MVIPGDSGAGGGGVIPMHIFGLWDEARVPITGCRDSEKPLATGDSKLQPSCYTVTSLPIKTYAVQLY